MLAINPQKALVCLQAQNNLPAWIVNPQPQVLRIHLFGKYIRDKELWISIFQAIDELVCS
jgi:hypothetical protein